MLNPDMKRSDNQWVTLVLADAERETYNQKLAALRAEIERGIAEELRIERICRRSAEESLDDAWRRMNRARARSARWRSRFWVAVFAGVVGWGFLIWGIFDVRT